MALMGLPALALLALLPSLVSAYSFDLTSAPTQCGQLNLKLTDGTGKPPYTATVMPYGQSVGNVEQRRVFQHQFSDSSTSFQLPYPQDSNFVIMVGDSDGRGSGGTSVPTTVGKSSNTSCLPESVSVLFSFQILPTTAINQCKPVTLAWNSSAQDPVSITLAIPGGQSQDIKMTNVGTQPGSTTGFNWTPNVRAGLNIILLANDARGVGTGGSANAIVAFSPTDDSSCLDSNAPSSTAGTPAGAVETGGSGHGGGSGEDNESSSKTNTGAIAGGIVGGVVALLIIALLAWFFLRRRRAHRHPAAHGVDLLPEGAPQRDPDHPPEFYQPEPFIVPPSHSGHEEDTTHRPSMSDRRYSAVSTTDQSESVFLGAGAMSPSTSGPTSSRKSPAGLPQLRPVNFVQHEDAGEVEEGPSQPAETIELPPSYTSVRK